MKVITWPLYYGLFPLFLTEFGKERGAILLGTLQLILVIPLVFVYDFTKRDPFGVQVFKMRVREKWNELYVGPWWKRGSWLVTAFIFLCNQTDPFTVFISMRREGKTGIDFKGLLVIVGSIALTTWYWAFFETLAGHLFMKICQHNF